MFEKKKDEPVDMRLIVLAAATKALNHKRAHPELSDDQIVSYISTVADEIIKSVK